MTRVTRLAGFPNASKALRWLDVRKGLRMALLLVFALAPGALLKSTTVTVNAAVTHQVIDGFGSATAWNTISSAQAPSAVGG